MAAWRDVRRIAMAFPGTLETSEPGKYAWTVNKKAIAWQRPLRKSDIAALGTDAPAGQIACVRTPDVDFKDLLCKSDPMVYFTTPHFNGYAAILIRLEAATSKHLREVLTEAWLTLAPKDAVNAFLQERGALPATRSAKKAKPTRGRSRAKT